MSRGSSRALLALGLLGGVACSPAEGELGQTSFGGDEGSASADADDGVSADASAGETQEEGGEESADTSSDSDSDSGSGPKFDVDGSPDVPGCVGPGEVEHSYIWIANSSQGTVSKINTVDLTEEGRYRVRPDHKGSPSRTSVGLSGDVAVANRSGGVTKVWADPTDCVESNGQPGIQTSSGADHVLVWGEEECIAWHTAFPGYTTQRPVAWTQGEVDPETCATVDEKVWTAGGGGPGTHHVSLLDGETGAVEETVDIPNVIGWAGLYGGAVDGDGNFYTVDHNWKGPSTLIRVDRGDFSFDKWDVPGPVHYGITVDSKGRPWLCGRGGASRFDPESETWKHLPPIGETHVIGGCMSDGEGTLWTGAFGSTNLLGIDTETVEEIASIPIPSYVHGVSIDFQGYVWGVAFLGDKAYRIDPQTQEVDTVGGLVGAYTYSDMTGFALSSAGVPAG